MKDRTVLVRRPRSENLTYPSRIECWSYTGCDLGSWKHKSGQPKGEGDGDIRERSARLAILCSTVWSQGCDVREEGYSATHVSNM
jgi:hypothetical protein